MATWTNQTENTTTYTNQTESLANTLATAGLYYGFGAFTYSGGEVLSTTEIIYTNQTKN